MEIVSIAPTAPFGVTFHSKAEKGVDCRLVLLITLTSCRSATQNWKAGVLIDLGLVHTDLGIACDV